MPDGKLTHHSVQVAVSIPTPTSSRPAGPHAQEGDHGPVIPPLPRLELWVTLSTSQGSSTQAPPVLDLWPRQQMGILGPSEAGPGPNERDLQTGLPGLGKLGSRWPWPGPADCLAPARAPSDPWGPRDKGGRHPMGLSLQLV